MPCNRTVSAVSDVIVGMKEAIKNGTLSIERLNDAVARIMSVKLALGAATQVKASNLANHKPTDTPIPHLSTEYEDSLTAVHESLVLLKNNGVIPVNPANL